MIDAAKPRKHYPDLSHQTRCRCGAGLLVPASYVGMEIIRCPMCCKPGEKPEAVMPEWARRGE